MKPVIGENGAPVKTVSIAKRAVAAQEKFVKQREERLRLLAERAKKKELRLAVETDFLASCGIHQAAHTPRPDSEDDEIELFTALMRPRIVTSAGHGSRGPSSSPWTPLRRRSVSGECKGSGRRARSK